MPGVQVLIQSKFAEVMGQSWSAESGHVAEQTANKWTRLLRRVALEGASCLDNRKC